MKISICPTCGHPREVQGTVTKSFVPPLVDPEKEKMKEILKKCLPYIMMALDAEDAEENSTVWNHLNDIVNQSINIFSHENRNNLHRTKRL